MSVRLPKSQNHRKHNLPDAKCDEGFAEEEDIVVSKKNKIEKSESAPVVNDVSSNGETMRVPVKPVVESNDIKEDSAIDVGNDGDSSEISESENDSYISTTEEEYSEEEQFVKEEAKHSHLSIELEKSRCRAKFNFEQIIKKYSNTEVSGVEIDVRTGDIYAPVEMKEEEVKTYLDGMERAGAAMKGYSVFSAVDNSAKTLGGNDVLHRQCEELDKMFEANFKANRISQQQGNQQSERQEEEPNHSEKLEADFKASCIEQQQSDQQIEEFEKEAKGSESEQQQGGDEPNEELKVETVKDPAICSSNEKRTRKAPTRFSFSTFKTTTKRRSVSTSSNILSGGKKSIVGSSTARRKSIMMKSCEAKRMKTTKT